MSSDPNDRAISGSSSGGIAALTVAFNRSNLFRRVLCFIGSFANLRGGDIYPALIRKIEPLPLRIFPPIREVNHGSFTKEATFGSQPESPCLPMKPS